MADQPKHMPAGDDCRMHRGRPRTAFTLMELVIVVLIMGIMAAVAAPSFSDSLCRFRVEAAARRIAADLNLARQTATTTETDQWVLFYPASNYYKLYNDPDPDHPSQEYVVKLSKTQYPVSLTSVEFENQSGYTTNWRVVFDMYGRAKAGLFWLEPLVSGAVIVSSGSEQRTVVINPITGEASVQ